MNIYNNDKMYESYSNEVERMQKCIDELQQENQQLKEQLHEVGLQIQEMIEQDIECPSNCSKIEELKNQQKEFVKYLEDEIKMYSNTYMGEMLKEIDEILSKYKEIIGGNNE